MSEADAKNPDANNPGEQHSDEPPEEVRHPDGWIEHPTVKREERDVWAGRTMLVLAICLCIGGLDVFIVWHFFMHNETAQAARKASTYPLAPPPSSPSKTPPPEPRLDPLNRMIGNEQANVFETQLHDLARLNEVGPAKEKGFVRIPIQEAIKQVIPRLKVSKQPDPAAGKDDGLRYGGGPNSGRVFEEEPK